MSDPDDTPTDRPGQKRGYRSHAPSAAEWIEAVTAAHRFDSAPPGVRKAWAWMAYAATRTARYVWVNKAPLLVSHAVGAAWMFAVHHCGK